MAEIHGLTLVVVLFVMVVVVPAGVWWFRQHPNRSKRYPNRQRMPRFMAVLGWIAMYDVTRC